MSRRRGCVRQWNQRTTGVGDTGQAFVDSLRSRLGNRSVGVYAVNYPASLDFPTAADGVMDASSHAQSMAANFPATEMVLGGYSQGAAVTGYITSDAVPAGYIPPPGSTGPMPAGVADHVAAVALFGRPSNDFLNRFGAPPITIGRLYKDKTVDVCANGGRRRQRGSCALRVGQDGQSSGRFRVAPPGRQLAMTLKR